MKPQAAPEPSAWRENLSTYLVIGTLVVVTAVAFFTRYRLNRDVPPPTGGNAIGERFVITFMTPANEVAEKAYDQLLRSFERRHPELKVKFDLATGGRTFASIIATKMFARQSPDVFFFEDEDFPEFARDNAFLPLDAYIEADQYDVSDFFEKAQEEFQFNGTTYGVADPGFSVYHDARDVYPNYGAGEDRSVVVRSLQKNMVYNRESFIWWSLTRLYD